MQGISVKLILRTLIVPEMLGLFFLLLVLIKSLDNVLQGFLLLIFFRDSFHRLSVNKVSEFLVRGHEEGLLKVSGIFLELFVNRVAVEAPVNGVVDHLESKVLES